MRQHGNQLRGQMLYNTEQMYFLSKFIDYWLVSRRGRPERGPEWEEVWERLRPVEELQAGGAKLGQSLGGGQAGLAHRVLRHGEVRQSGDQI